MPATPGKPKTTFKTYEASTRLLAAVVATSGAKLDFNAIARHMGGDATKDAINHRLRPIKQLAKMQAACLAKGEDPGELPVEKGALAGLVGGDATAAALEHRMRPIKQLAKMQIAYRDQGKDPGKLPVEKGEIQKLFGESTPQGLEWQFRDIKALGKAQQEAVDKGQSPATLTVGNTPGSRASKTPGTGGRKRKAATPVVPQDSSDSLANNGDNDDSDHDDVQETPTKRPAAKKVRTATPATPSKKAKGKATTLASSTLASVSTPITDPSIFGDGSAPVFQSTEAVTDAVQMTPRGHRTHGETTERAAQSVAVKKELISHAESFFAGDGAGDFGEEVPYEDGEV